MHFRLKDLIGKFDDDDGSVVDLVNFVFTWERTYYSYQEFAEHRSIVHSKTTDIKIERTISVPPRTHIQVTVEKNCPKKVIPTYLLCYLL